MRQTSTLLTPKRLPPSTGVVAPGLGKSGPDKI